MLPQDKELFVKTTPFAYNGTHCQQVFGTGMGSPVSVVIANMVIEEVERKAIANSPVKSFFWKLNDMSMMLFLRYPEMKWSAYYRI